MRPHHTVPADVAQTYAKTLAKHYIDPTMVKDLSTADKSWGSDGHRHAGASRAAALRDDPHPPCHCREVVDVTLPTWSRLHRVELNFSRSAVMLR